MCMNPDDEVTTDMTKYRRMPVYATVLCLLITLACLVCIPAMAEDTLGITTAKSVNVRVSASSSAKYLFQAPIGLVCEILEVRPADKDGIVWYKVKAVDPDPQGCGEVTGYIHGGYFRPLTADETAQYRETHAVSTPTQTAGSGARGVVTNGGTNLREGPSIHSHSMLKLDRGTEVEILAIPNVISSETFYKVRFGGETGYIMSTFIRVTSSGDVAAPTAVPATAVPENNEATPTPTPVPESGDPTPTPAPATHVQLILSSCHLRETPGGKFDTDNDWTPRGATLPLAGEAVTKDGYTWYPVTKNNKTYYVRNDCVQLVSGGATPTSVPTSAPSDDSGAVGYVRTIVGGVNLRSTINGTVIKQIKKNVTMPYLLAPMQKNGYTWYFVKVDGNRGYVRGDTVKVVSGPSNPTAAPTAAPDATATPAPAPTTAPTGYVRTTAGGVNLRVSAGYTDRIGSVARDVVMPYYGEPTTVKNVLWYNVVHPTLGKGWLHGDYVEKCDEKGNTIVVPTATPEPGTTAAPSQSGQQEASYNTLKLGSTGTAVRNLVAELKNQGYYTGSLTSNYTSAVQEAVKKFQKAKGLSVDGVAGAATQHKLFNTVPIGAGDHSNLTMDLYPAEKVDWYTGGINELWKRGDNYKVYDVKTGIVWWAHRWAGGSHVDAEPLTAADTARLCKTYGVTTSQEIKDKNLYERRPLLVTIGTRTFACSMYGVPHNYPEGDTISNNDFRGQVCIHFTNSKTHNSNKVDKDHEAAIQYAWEHCPAGHK